MAEGDEGLIVLTGLGFMYKRSEITKSLEEDVLKHLDTERVRVFMRGESLAGYICSKQVETPRGRLYDLEGIVFHPKHQGRHLGRRSLVSELKTTGAKLIGLQTQRGDMKSLAEAVSYSDPYLTYELASYIGTDNPQYVTTGDGQLIVKQPGRYKGKPLYNDMIQFIKNEYQIPGVDTEAGDALVLVNRVKENI